MILEDDVKSAMEKWMSNVGYLNVVVRLGRKSGFDVEGVNQNSDRRLVVECKGEASTGDQHRRSWPNVASAMLTSLYELEKGKNSVGIALPNTKVYQDRMKDLRGFCSKNGIAVFWVSANGDVAENGSTNRGELTQ